jgi:alkylation response protein AidB-like acyl-CoA dehydrogenase
MTAFQADVRDLKFVLFEQLRFERLFNYERYRELDRDTVEAVLDAAYDLARSAMAPLNNAADREGARYDKATGAVKVPAGFHEIHRHFVEGGWVGLSQAPEFGGQGMPWTLHLAARDLFFGACMSFCLWPMLSSGAAHLVELFGSEELKRTYLANMYSGRWSGTMCLTEPGAGSDVGAARTKAKKSGDHYLIEGEKIFISYGEHDLTDQI